MRRGKFVRDCPRATSQISFGRLGMLLLPFVNFGLELFQMRRARIDLFQHRLRLRVIRECGQGRDSIFLPRQRFKLFLLLRRFLLRPIASRIARHRFDSANARRDRFFSDDPE